DLARCAVVEPRRARAKLFHLVAKLEEALDTAAAALELALRRRLHRLVADARQRSRRAGVEVRLALRRRHRLPDGVDFGVRPYHRPLRCLERRRRHALWSNGHAAALHHKTNAAHGLDFFQRIALYRNQIRLLARLDRARDRADADRLG